jgi:hypothetical protein
MSTTKKNSGQIIQIAADTWQLTSGQHCMQLKRAPVWGGWYVSTWNACTRATSINKNLGATRAFNSLADVEKHYKSWRGVSRLIDENATAKNPQPPYVTDATRTAARRVLREEAYLEDLHRRQREAIDQALRDLADRSRRQNPGEGALFYFHGAFNDRHAAISKALAVPKSFIRPVYFRGGMRYAVLTSNGVQNPAGAAVARWHAGIPTTQTGRSARSYHPSVIPLGPKRCAVKNCKTPTQNVELDHKNGNNADIRRANHQWLCRRHNAIKAIRQRAAGQGERIERQWNKDAPKVGTLVIVTKAKLRKPRGTKATRTTLHPAPPKGLRKNPSATTAALYTAAAAADKAWHAELVKVYGKKDAGTARFDKRGKATPELKALHDQFTEAMSAWREAAAAAKRNPLPEGWQRDRRLAAAAITLKQRMAAAPQYAKAQHIEGLMRDHGYTNAHYTKAEQAEVRYYLMQSVKNPRWVRTAGGTVGKVLEVQGKPGAYRYRLEIPGVGLAWAKGRVYDVPAPTKKATKKNPRSGATLPAAKRLYKKFIGKASTKTTPVRTKHPAARGQGVAKLGVVNYLKLANPALRDGLIRFSTKERPALVSEANGRQYYLVGGGQNLDRVPPVRKSNPGQLADLGEVKQIEYFERKGVEGFRPVNYYHNFGEENGKRPRLMYDRQRKQMHLVGGNYRTLASGINN